MAVIGIDPGTAITGYGIVEELGDGSLRAIDYGVLKTTANEITEVRLKLIFEQLNRLLLLHSLDCAAVEKLFFQKNVKTALSVGQARGVILLSLTLAKMKVYEYNPVDIKQSVAGYGHADKKQMQQMVKILLGLDRIPEPDDAADALAVAICHIHSIKLLNSIEPDEDDNKFIQSGY
jgi:crossover junction endodeoxyribonuclease RuvC